MTPETLSADLLRRFPELVPTSSWGETAFFFNPGARLPRGVYFATIKLKDGANDRASRLGQSRWRFNFAMQESDFLDRFGPMPKRPSKGGVVAGPWDFCAVDRLQPHPVYGWMGWVAVINPSQDMYGSLLPLLQGAHARASALFARRSR